MGGVSGFWIARRPAKHEYPNHSSSMKRDTQERARNLRHQALPVYFEERFDSGDSGTSGALPGHILKGRWLRGSDRCVSEADALCAPYGWEERLCRVLAREKDFPRFLLLRGLGACEGSQPVPVRGYSGVIPIPLSRASCDWLLVPVLGAYAGPLPKSASSRSFARWIFPLNQNKIKERGGDRSPGARSSACFLGNEAAWWSSVRTCFPSRAGVPAPEPVASRGARLLSLSKGCDPREVLTRE